MAGCPKRRSTMARLIAEAAGERSATETGKVASVTDTSRVVVQTEYPRGESQRYRAEAVIACLEKGMTLPYALQVNNLDASVFQRALNTTVPEGRQRYLRALEIRADMWADETIQIADTEEDPNRARNRIMARQWVISKQSPRIYGDRVDVNFQGSISINDALTMARARLTPTVMDAETVETPTLECKDDDIFN